MRRYRYVLYAVVAIGVSVAVAATISNRAEERRLEEYEQSLPEEGGEESIDEANASPPAAPAETLSLRVTGVGGAEDVLRLREALLGVAGVDLVEFQTSGASAVASVRLAEGAAVTPEQLRAAAEAAGFGDAEAAPAELPTTQQRAARLEIGELLDEAAEERLRAALQQVTGVQDVRFRAVDAEQVTIVAVIGEEERPNAEALLSAARAAGFQAEAAQRRGGSGRGGRRGGVNPEQLGGLVPPEETPASRRGGG